MNKTVNINLAGIFFHIDEDAYLKLSRYLEAIKRSFTDSQGRSEIIADIEARIAELFAERIQNEKQVVGVKLVDEVITIMGQPEDYLVDDEIFEDEPQQQYKQKSSPSRRLYRDTDNSYVGGVSAGLGHYFGIDALWVRLLWVLLIFGAGTGILLYILLWALIPEAKTTAEKLTMTGDPVNISNIEKKIKDGIDTVSETVKNVDLKKHGDKLKKGFDHVSDNISETVKNVDFQKQGTNLKSSSQNFFDTIGNIIMFFLKLFTKFIGLILIFTGITALIALIVAYFTVGITNAIYFPPMDFLDAANAANVPMWLMSTLLFFVFAIPFFFVFYSGLKILVNNLKSIGNVAKFTLLGLWLMSIIGIVVIGVKQATEHAYDAEIMSKANLNIKANDTLKIKMVGFDRFNSFVYSDHNNFRITEDDNGRSLVSSNIRIIVYSTTDSVAKINIIKEASGSNYSSAKERAENISYDYTFSNNELQLEAYHASDVENKYSEQEVRVILYLPEGAVLYSDVNTSRYINRYYNSYNSLLTNSNDGHYLKINKNEVECLDCEEEVIEEIEIIEEEKEEFIEESTEIIESITNETPSQINKPEVSIKINDEDGVNIEVNDN
ncbi:PspC domain-containing protein [Winogradskyella psychrotolerans]|uniref:PspC domain-containing protein n=1 Tax=Winogradskyella psychrotolerans TaxID=1344585 RepID=UPI001C06C527|nr:PspC domain-containing protein [Winogradskyella psychrotolerans]MBU2929472.1 PspC domain-containing protein [Winogradskyella psychrotolerans]